MNDDPRSPLPEEPPPNVPRRRRGRPRKDAREPGEPDTRAAILASAAYLFATRGYENASLADIAAGAGATTGAIYAHFRGKPELLVEVIRETLAFLSFRAANLDRLRGPGALGGYVRWLLHPDRRTTRRLINEVYTTADRVPEVFEMVSDYARTEAGAVAARIRGWQETGHCAQEIDADLTAQQFFIDVLGLCRVDSFSPTLLDSPAWHELVQRRVQELIGATDTDAHRPRSAKGTATRSK